MKNIVVLGAGRVGSAIARDLSHLGRVTVADIDESLLNNFSNASIVCKKIDLTQEGNVSSLIQEADLVIGAVPGWLGFRVFKEVISAGKNIVDISFFSEDALELEAFARQHNSVAVFDAGVAPGLCNIWLGDILKDAQVLHYACYVGGLPFERVAPWEYKAPFSPVDVIEEYTRPARHVEKSRVVEKPALGGSEIITFDQVGELEAFDTDGLRSLLTTVEVPDMIEKTLRYPGHREKMEALREGGFFSSKLIDVGEIAISPLSVTEKLLLSSWQLTADDREFTAMRVCIKAKYQDQIVTKEFELFDETDTVNKESSMARTTGFTCTAIASLILDGQLHEPGLYAPEHVGMAGHLPQIKDYLAKRHVTWTTREH